MFNGCQCDADFLNITAAILSVNLRNVPNSGGIYKFGSFSNTISMQNTWLQSQPDAEYLWSDLGRLFNAQVRLSQNIW